MYQTHAFYPTWAQFNEDYYGFGSITYSLLAKCLTLYEA